MSNLETMDAQFHKDKELMEKRKAAEDAFKKVIRQLRPFSKLFILPLAGANISANSDARCADSKARTRAY